MLIFLQDVYDSVNLNSQTCGISRFKIFFCCSVECFCRKPNRRGEKDLETKSDKCLNTRRSRTLEMTQSSEIG